MSQGAAAGSVAVTHTDVSVSVATVLALTAGSTSGAATLYWHRRGAQHAHTVSKPSQVHASASDHLGLGPLAKETGLVKPGELGLGLA